MELIFAGSYLWSANVSRNPQQIHSPIGENVACKIIAIFFLSFFFKLPTVGGAPEVKNLTWYAFNNCWGLNYTMYWTSLLWEEHTLEFFIPHDTDLCKSSDNFISCLYASQCEKIYILLVLIVVWKCREICKCLILPTLYSPICCLQKYDIQWKCCLSEYCQFMMALWLQVSFNVEKHASNVTLSLALNALIQS